MFLKPRDKNLAAVKSNSQRPFYHASDFDSIVWFQYILPKYYLIRKEKM